MSFFKKSLLYFYYHFDIYALILIKQTFNVLQINYRKVLFYDNFLKV